MKRFKVIETNESKYKNQEFMCETRIRNEVELPFSSKKFRCTMFTGLKIRLVADNDYIIGIIC
jgi:hypothetical protein